MQPHEGVCRLLLVWLLAATVLVSLNDAMAKGTPWNITVGSAADADGGTITVTVNLKLGDLVAPVVVNVVIDPNMSANDKAARIANALNLSVHLDASATGNVVNVEVTDTSGFEDIAGVDINDDQTGEKITGVKDDPTSDDTLFTAYFDLRGVGGTPGAEAVLQIGDDGPLVYTDTEGRLAYDIEADLVDSFNVAYGGRGYTAEHIGDEIVIDSVPCPEGITAGSDDSQLSWHMGLRPLDPRGVLPSLSTWGLIILSSLVLASGIWLYLRRRMRPASSR